MLHSKHGESISSLAISGQVMREVHILTDEGVRLEKHAYLYSSSLSDQHSTSPDGEGVDIISPSHPTRMMSTERIVVSSWGSR